MTALLRKNRKGILLGLAPLFCLAVVFVLNACDAGDAPDPPTGPDATYDPNFDEGRSGVTVQASPSSVTVPDPVTGESGEVLVIATYRTPEGNRQSGLQMNFTADPYNPAVSFNPPAAFTNSKGIASTTAYISKSIPEGSVTIVAYTSPASGGPSARGQTQVFVNVGEIVTVPTIPAGSASSDSNPAVGVINATISVSTSGASSNLGNTIQYRFDCNGAVSALLPVGTSSFVCNVSGTGTSATFLVRAQAQSSTGLTSDWSGAATFTVNDQ